MNNVLFVHIPKTGGTSIEQLFDLRRYLGAGQFKSAPLVRNGRVHFQHATMKTIMSRKNLTSDYYDDAFIFTFVRNPYDRAVSHFAFCKQNHKWGVDKDTTFKQYLLKTLDSFSHHGPMVEFIRGYEDRLDFIGRFENFEADVKEVAEAIGDGDVEVPHVNQSVHKPYRKAYTPETKGLVEKIFQEDFEVFDYDYEDW